MKEHIDRLRAEINKVLIGQENLVEDCIRALLSGGHVLLEGAPGLGKTLLVKTIGQAIDLKTSRIQFTPDLMPADIVGTNILIEKDGPGNRPEIRFSPGPIFANLVLADEINRATPKTQSALLESMQEGSVTAFGQTYTLDSPFFVMATQNPIEMEGTYPLPEAQVDRFLFKLLVPTPKPDDLMKIVEETTGPDELAVNQVFDREKLIEANQLVREIPIASHIIRYAVHLVAATHPDAAEAPDRVKQYVVYGASPRGAQSLVLAAKARALMEGRFNVATDDIRHVAKPALRHRLILGFQADADGVTADDIIDQLLESVRHQEVK